MKGFRGWLGVLLGGSSRAERPTPKILDTSALIDGRIADVAAHGFLEGPLLVPAFVLREMQSVADAADRVRRSRGRMGFEVLERLRSIPRAGIAIVEEDVPEAEAVDDKLVVLAKRHGAALVTTDFNLNRAASARGIRVLNLNALAQALRPAAVPGESLTVTPVKEGKEPDQGVAYLDDGTMVVVERVKGLLGRPVEVVVTSVIQTAAGRMFFARPAAAVPPGEADQIG